MIILKNRILREDGISIVNPEDIGKLLLKGLTPSQLLTTEIDDEIELFNSISDETINLFSDDNFTLNYNWNIPKEYQELDLIEYFCKFINDDNESRIIEELQIIIDNDLHYQIRSIIFVIDTLKQKNIVWGLGRGSSCASYLLYLIGVHTIDPIKYDIPCREFFHD
jgi:DNA polymerase III alpha subunit